MFRKLIVIALAFVALSFAEFPKDNPLAIREGNQDKFAQMIAPYIEMAKRTFPDVKKKFLAGVYQKEHRILQVQITLSDKNGLNEMTFMKVLGCKGDFFKGVINNDLRMVKGYAYGDTISFMQNEILNWVVQDSTGREEGNFVGKAIEAIQFKNVGIIFEVFFQKGEFNLKYMRSIVGDEIDVEGILPKAVIDEAADLLKKNYRKKLKDGDSFKENEIFYTYHVYDFVNKKFVE
ncbi:hypothetical protein [Fibrobacter sp.]|uniref:hypothetical protein n=1 Tax=Fibrobacter sp. TaxID=35828 RepID=UPI00388FE274